MGLAKVVRAKDPRFAVWVGTYGGLLYEAQVLHDDENNWTDEGFRKSVLEKFLRERRSP
jgi:cation transport regulator ChaC